MPKDYLEAKEVEVKFPRDVIKSAFAGYQSTSRVVTVYEGQQTEEVDFTLSDE